MNKSTAKAWRVKTWAQHKINRANVAVASGQVGLAAKRGWFFSMMLLMASCASTFPVGQAIDAYRQQAAEVSLGQSKQAVLALLSPTQARLTYRQIKPPEQYYENEKLREIYFFRSRTFADGLVTDDEFTPYVFEEGKLIAIGWTAIGGPKTQAQQRDRDDFYHHYRGGVFFY